MPTLVKAEVDGETNGIIEEVQNRQDCNKKEAAEFLLRYGGTHWLRVHGDDDEVLNE